MTLRRLVPLLVCTALLAPGAALAQDSFGPLPQAPPEPPQQPPPSDPRDDEGLSSTQQLLVAAAGILVLGGIAFAIVRDARRAAPTEGRAPADIGQGKKGSRTPPRQRAARGRSKSRAARKARRKNR
jgi:hypothetical protein